MSIESLPVTITFVAICAIALMPMTGWIGLYRGSTGILRGDGGDPVLFKRSRIHGNFIENAPLTAMSLAVAEALGMGATFLWLAVASFFAGRILHAVMYDQKIRALPMTLTQAPGVALGIWALLQVWGG